MNDEEKLNALLEAFIARSKAILNDELCGIYLHGSAVMGCFSFDRSDVDLIVVVHSAMTDGAKREFMKAVVELNAIAPPKGIEMSVVTKAVCKPFIYPTPYELHFSSGHLAWYTSEPEDYIRKMNGTDKDLAAHFTIIRRRGRAIYGAPIDEVFGEVPKDAYMDSIVFDVAEAREEITEYTTYLALNLARVLAYCRDELVLSKKEGGEWALEHIDDEFRPLIKSALSEYIDGEAAEYDPACAKRYAEYMLERICAEMKKVEENSMNTDASPLEPKIKELFSLFFNGVPVSAELIDTSRGEDDLRNSFIITDSEGGKFVLKIVSNDFTIPDRIRMWQRTAEEYRREGYYCPRIFCDKSGGFPEIEYRGKRCIVYAEEFSKFKPLSERAAFDEGGSAPSVKAYFEDIWSMSAKIAAKKLDYTEFPSGYCLFETFCPSDRTDEVLENALEWKEYAFALPNEFRLQVQRIWDIWCANRAAFEKSYPFLPTSVFQADLNPTNLLVGDDGAFVGVYDFNLCGRDVFLNYLMRENYADFEEELDLIKRALTVASRHYSFSEAEKAAALPLYRCVKPLWYTRVCDLKQAGDDTLKIKHCLDRIEHYLTADIDFKSCMG